ncbi:hypothetical protein [Saccharopolyspora shandongensis]|uniref:hypothetical protein n=1 Tax=Saccharopolyspora shandongensis TaxID=418495 RepID=UPI00340D9C00
MTILDRIPRTADDEPVVAELPGPAELNTIAALLPEQEWCIDCTQDETGESGMPQAVVGRSVEQPSLLSDTWEPGPLLNVTRLSCGHTLVSPAAPSLT